MLLRQHVNRCMRMTTLCRRAGMERVECSAVYIRRQYCGRSCFIGGGQSSNRHILKQRTRRVLEGRSAALGSSWPRLAAVPAPRPGGVLPSSWSRPVQQGGRYHTRRATQSTRVHAAETIHVADVEKKIDYYTSAVQEVFLMSPLKDEDSRPDMAPGHEDFHCLPTVGRTQQIVPTPNLGYTCDNMTLKRTKKVYTSRTCIKKTFEAKGLEYVSQLALSNCLDLLDIITWNYQNGIYLYRMTSKLFPWCSHYELEQLPDYGLIVDALAAAGELARAAGQRITNHPSHFVKLAATREHILDASIKDVEVQSKIFDLMGYAPSHWNKINIHVGGVYGSKDKTISRFAQTFDRLSDHVKARLTVENDDTGNSYSVDDLLVLHDLTGIPITFDFHHHRFCPGTMSKHQAFEAAISTWPTNVRPVVHWSETPECPKRRKSHPHSHSNFVYGPINIYGREMDVDVMIESKAREAALLLYRDFLAKNRTDGIPEQPLMQAS